MKNVYNINSYRITTNSNRIKISSSPNAVVPILISISILIFCGIDLVPLLLSIFSLCLVWLFYFIRVHIHIDLQAQKIWKATSFFCKPFKISFYMNLASVKISAFEGISAGDDASGGELAYVVYAIQKTDKEKLFLIQLDTKEEVFLFESILKDAGYSDFEIHWKKS